MTRSVCLSLMDVSIFSKAMLCFDLDGMWFSLKHNDTVFEMDDTYWSVSWSQLDD